mgnify:CR=1 FL=1
MPPSAFARFRITRPLVLGLAVFCLTSLMAAAQSSVLVVDAFNKKVHVAGNANAKRHVGGLAKIATCMVTLDWAEASRVGVNVLAPVPDYAATIAGAASPLGLQAGVTAVNTAIGLIGAMLLFSTIRPHHALRTARAAARRPDG